MFLAYTSFPGWIHPELIKGVPFGSWYGMMYLICFAVTWLLFSHQVKQKRRLLNLPTADQGSRTAAAKKGGSKRLSADSKTFRWLFYPSKTPTSAPLSYDYTTNTLSAFYTWLIVGLLLGARLFSVLFYSDNNLYYLTHPWMIFWPFENGTFVGLRGMSYHGGVVGIVIAGLIFCYRKRLHFLEMADMLIAGAPLGYTFGRLGNFINQELYGRVTLSPLGMIFNPPGMETFSTAQHPWAADIANRLNLLAVSGQINLPRHPSQLYEAFFEGFFLWLLMWFAVSRLKRHNGQGLGFYIFGYGLIRFIIEYFREPDSNLGYILNFTGRKDLIPALEHPFGAISMGQIFCFLMIVFGLLLIFTAPLLNRQWDRLLALRTRRLTQAALKKGQPAPADSVPEACARAQAAADALESKKDKKDKKRR